MDIKEIGAGAVIVIGGIAYTVSEGGLADALTEDIKHISEVSLEDRPNYMAGIVEDFTETFGYYIVQTGDYDYLAAAKFKAVPSHARFETTAQAEETTDQANIDAVKREMESYNMCEQSDIVMFTDQGWNYKLTMKDAQGRRFYSITCNANTPKLRGAA